MNPEHLEYYKTFMNHKDQYSYNTAMGHFRYHTKKMQKHTLTLWTVQAQRDELRLCAIIKILNI
ncbi:hypothetical protein [Escherichia phage vB_EcoM_JNE01]|nr:hypothetical protein [Escherichia phage vB_EcoM_JNE01]